MSTEQTSGNIFTYKDVNDLIGKKKNQRQVFSSPRFSFRVIYCKILKVLVKFHKPSLFCETMELLQPFWGTH